MDKKKPFALDWPSVKKGTMLHMTDFPSVRLLKLDDRKGCYFGYETDLGTLVDVKTHTSEINGEYYYFSMSKEDWHPLTNRLWSYD